MGIIAVIGAAMFGAFLGFVTYMILDRRCYLTDDDYKIINSKFEDVWKDVCGLKHRVRELEDAKDDDRCDDLNDIRISDRVMVKHPKKGWVKGCVMEKCLCAAFVVSDGECIWTDKVRKIEK